MTWLRSVAKRAYKFFLWVRETYPAGQLQRVDQNVCSESRQISPNLFFLGLSAAFQAINYTPTPKHVFLLASGTPNSPGYSLISLATPAGSSANSSPSPRTKSVEMPQGSLSPPSPSLLSSATLTPWADLLVSSMLTTPKFITLPRTSPWTPLPNCHFHLHVQLDVQFGTPPKPNLDLPFHSGPFCLPFIVFSRCSGQKPQSLLNSSFFHSSHSIHQ